VSARIPFLWLCGPSGVGKTTVGWEIFRQLADAGLATAFVDADQLGLCYPSWDDDPQNHRIKARNLGQVWAAFRAAGAESVVMSGGFEVAEHVGAYANQVPEAALTLCRLRAGHATLTDRFVARGWMSHLASEAVAGADELDRLDFGDLRVDTDGLSVAAVARLVRERAGGWPPSTNGALLSTQTVAALGDPVPVLMLCGAAAVGKSTVGYEVFTRVGSNIKAAYIDLAQIGFCHPAPADDPDHHRLKAANLAAMWPAFRDAGARCLVVTGRVNDAAAIRAYADALSGMTLTVCRLHAGREALIERVQRRGRGEGPNIAGEELRGKGSAVLHEVADQAARDADRLHRDRHGDLWIGTDGHSIEEVAGFVRDSVRERFERRAGSPTPGGGPPPARRPPR